VGAGLPPLARLARGQVPAAVLRGVIPPVQCRQIIERMCRHRFYPPEWHGLLGYDGAVADGGPDGDWSGERTPGPNGRGWRMDHPERDLGGWAGSKGEYFDWVDKVHSDELLRTLGVADLMEQMREAVTALSGKRGVRAEEGGRPYGLANVRAHQPAGPHRIPGTEPRDDCAPSPRHRHRPAPLLFFGSRLRVGGGCHRRAAL